MAHIVGIRRRQIWPLRVLEIFGRFRGFGRLPRAATADLNELSDHQLRDIGLDRTDIGAQVERDMAALRRKGIGPFA